ncbi:TonB-dependent receptor domain-containing protein [Sphingopyxis terrae]|uniref:TonB-dependent receptor domain-containing protein n=1 Tax=Sphingopyxis terrae TaxID=33052 RepID=UPI000787407F|nr:TonB-dependent receptor [Sphingopyxis terrae]
MLDNRKLLLTISASIISLAGAPVWAQTDSATDQAAEEAPAQEIVVTGSRISRRDFEAPSPIVTLGSDAVSSTGSVTLEGALNQLPQFTPDSTAFSNDLNSTGQATLNLRGLGAQRNLVLLDGRRLQPSNSSQVIDINTLPTILIGGAEIISGGASAVHGSDAISGVVNFKLRQIDGLEVSGQNTITSRGDGGIREISLGGGTRFADGRGQVTVGVSYTDRDAININSRAFFRQNRGVSSTIPLGLFTPGANAPDQAAVDAAFAAYGIAPGSVPASSSIGINPDGTLFSTGRGVYNYRDDVPFVLNTGSALLATPQLTYSQIPLERISTFGRATFEASDNLKLFVQGLYTDYTSTTIADAAPNAGLWTMRVPVTSPFIPDALRPLLDARANPAAPVVVTKRYSEVGPRRTDHDATTWQILGGASGKLGNSDISWELYGSTGKSVVDDIANGSVFTDRVQTLVSAPDGGASLCDGGYNPFSATNSAECVAYISGVTRNRTETRQDVVELNIQGGLAQLPAGDLRFAVGAGYRRNEFSFAPDAQQITGNVVAIARTSPTAGSTRAIEGYAELLVPVLRDVFAIRELTLDFAYRYSDYKQSGGVSTYKVDVDWTVTDGVRLRGGYQRAIRAPNVGELYTATTGLYPTIGLIANGGGDPCDIRSSYRTGSNGAAVRGICVAQGMPDAIADVYVNNVAQVAAYLSGNQNLKPEKADTYTIGAVFSPRAASPWLSGIRASIDYYNIAIDDAIAVIPVSVSLNKCFNGDGSNPGYDAANFYCSLIGRDAGTGGITNALQPYLNLGGYRTAGVDVQLDWSVRMADIGLGDGSGRFGISSVINYLDKFEIQNLPGSPFQDFARTIGSGTTLPRWRSTTSFTYGTDSINALLRWRHIGAMADASTVTNAASTTPGVKAYDYFDASLRIDPVDHFSLRLGVNNLFDKTPPVVSGVPGTTDAGTYDVLGRTFYLSATARF